MVQKSRMSQKTLKTRIVSLSDNQSIGVSDKSDNQKIRHSDNLMLRYSEFSDHQTFRVLRVFLIYQALSLFVCYLARVN